MTDTTKSALIERLRSAPARFDTACEAADEIERLRAQLEAAQADAKRKQDALAVAKQALNDWILTYAPEFCDQHHVSAAQQRIHAVGTLAYIADAVQVVRAAMQAEGAPPAC
jgi:hypothetical protein